MTKEIHEKLYLFSCPSYGIHDFVKVGVSKNPLKRLAQCRSTYDHLLEVSAIYATPKARLIEDHVKAVFWKHRRKRTEFFAVKLGPVMDFIKKEYGLEPIDA